MLEEDTEILLMKYHDGECSAAEKKKAEEFLRSSQEANQYIDTLKSVSLQAKEWGSEVRSSLVLQGGTFWNGIVRQIAREEAARSVDDQTGSSWYDWFARLGWGVSGAFVAASIGLFVLRQPDNNLVGDGTLIRDGTGVNQNSSSLSNRPLPFVRGISLHEAPMVRTKRSAVEVDWIRSDGMLKVVQDPSQQSTIIWVKKRPENRFGKRKGPIVLQNSPQTVIPVSGGR